MLLRHANQRFMRDDQSRTIALFAITVTTIMIILMVHYSRVHMMVSRYQNAESLSRCRIAIEMESPYFGPNHKCIWDIRLCAKRERAREREREREIERVREREIERERERERKRDIEIEKDRDSEISILRGPITPLQNNVTKRFGTLAKVSQRHFQFL